MSYVTLEVKIDHGRIITKEPEKLPQSGRGLLTVIESQSDSTEPQPLSPREAFRALQKSLNVDDAKANAWMQTIQKARR
jgi:hypothetical protein